MLENSSLPLYSDIPEEEDENKNNSDKSNTGTLFSKSTLQDLNEAIGRLGCLEPTQNQNHHSHQPQQSIADSRKNVSRICQLETWDCGVACLLMAHSWICRKGLPMALHNNDNNDDDDNMFSARRQAIVQAIGSESIWTAELVYQLHLLLLTNDDNDEDDNANNSQKANYLFVSKEFQVQEGHQELGFYRETFSHDQVRVSRVFEKLADMQANMVCLDHLPLELVIKLVDHSHCIAIVLIDNTVLLGSGYRLDGNAPYVGHYVILCGLSRDPQDIKSAKALDGGSGDCNSNNDDEKDYCMVLCNPGQYQIPFLCVTPHRFERAWRSQGTDDDIIFIVRPPDNTSTSTTNGDEENPINQSIVMS